MSDQFGAVIDQVRDRFDPDPDERARLQQAAQTLIERAEQAVADLDVSADVVQVGSTARGTWTSGDRDIDIFVRFPPSLSRSALESHGLAVGWAVLPDGREEYAEHPYVTGEFEGFAVDVVPCFAVESASSIQSAVDRTPFHNAYVRERIDAELAGDIRLAKGFCKAVGVYGSDLRTRGLSGYCIELLVLEYGSFEAFCSAVRAWQLPVRLDPESHATESFDDPLVVIDPTDPARNVAAVCSTTNVARLIHHTRELSTAPTVDQFDRPEISPLSTAEYLAILDRRATTPVAIRFAAPSIVDDQLYPQLERSLEGLSDELDRHGFAPIRAVTFADDTAVLYVECGQTTLPAIERHVGPPVDAGSHARAFVEKYADTDACGPFIDGDRYVVERTREIRTIEQLIDERLLSVKLGVSVKERLESEYELLVGEATAALVSEFGVALHRYFSPRP